MQFRSTHLVHLEPQPNVAERPWLRETGEPTSTLPEALRQRELEIVREIANAGLRANHPVEVYRLALVRVTPLVQASFSSVFLRDDADPELLRLVCAQNWPQSSARFLSQMRIRVGRGPTGQAVAGDRDVEVLDVFADPSLREWWDPARELGFASLITLPLRSARRVEGALSFYFAAPRTFDDDERTLLALVAEQLAATAERSQVTESLQTQRSALEARVAELEARISGLEALRARNDEFLGNLGHELRTPINAILGYSYLLSSGHSGELNDDQSTGVMRIERSAGALLRLVQDLLELSALRLGRANITRTHEDGVALARRALDAVGAAPAGVTLRLEPRGTHALVTDADKVVHILENLLSNALKFTTRGEVVLEVRGWEDEAARQHVEWSVRDTGIGIRATDLADIFDEFTQVDGTSTRLYAGTGLGLAVSRHLARLLGGGIDVESEFGSGSRFTLRLPAQ